MKKKKYKGSLHNQFHWEGKHAQSLPQPREYRMEQQQRLRGRPFQPFWWISGDRIFLSHGRLFPARRSDRNEASQTVTNYGRNALSLKHLRHGWLGGQALAAALLPFRTFPACISGDEIRKRCNFTDGQRWSNCSFPRTCLAGRMITGHGVAALSDLSGFFFQRGDPNEVQLHWRRLPNCSFPILV